MANPFARITAETAEARALERLRAQVAKLPHRLAYERWLLGFTNPAPGLSLSDTRLAIRKLTQSAGRWTVEAQREQRQAQEARLALIAERARLVARKAVQA